MFGNIWQAYTSLAMGAKGLLYYCWHGGLEFPGGVLAPRVPLAEFKQVRHTTQFPSIGHPLSTRRTQAFGVRGRLCICSDSGFVIRGSGGQAMSWR